MDIFPGVRTDSIVTGSVPCMMIRGGTSKGAYFLKSDLPEDENQRDLFLLRAMGSPDPRQIDGLGGGHPLTSKVAIVSPALVAGAVDYLFLQIGVDTPTVSRNQNCGNLLAGVGPFAIERGLVKAQDGTTAVPINLVNTGGSALSVVSTPRGKVSYGGEQEIAGVPGRAARVLLEFSDTAGSSCGSLLPTGRNVDTIEGVETTCVDNGMPTVVVAAKSLGLSGKETPAELEANEELACRIESIRREAGRLMGLGDVSGMTVPKVSLISPATEGGTLATRTFIPWRVHEALGVLCAASIGVAWQLQHSALHDLPGSGIQASQLRLEHPSGFIDIEVEIDLNHVETRVLRTANVRTARKIFDGTLFVPDGAGLGMCRVDPGRAGQE